MTSHCYKLEDLREGMKVVLRNGEFGHVCFYKYDGCETDILLQLVDSKYKQTGYLILNQDYTEDLKCIDSPEYDVMEVYKYAFVYKRREEDNVESIQEEESYGE